MLEFIEGHDELIDNIRVKRRMVQPGVFTTEADFSGPQAPNDYLYRILSEVVQYPESLWSSMAKAHRYYDNSPFSQGEVAAMRQMGIPITNVNLIAPAVNTVTGLLIKANQTWKVEADDPEYIDVAMGIQKEFHDIVESSDLISSRIQSTHEAFIGGLSNLVIARNPDALSDPYISGTGHREEFFYDISNRHHRLANPRWTFRRLFVDVEEVDFYFPGGGKIARLSHQYFQNLMADGDRDNFPHLDGGTRFYDDPKAFMGGGHPDLLWDTQRQRVSIIEGYYSVPVKGLIMQFPNGGKRMFNPNDPMDVMLSKDPSVVIYNGMTRRTRQFWYIGQYRVADRWSPHPFQGAPWTPVVGARRDGDGTFYGLVENMIPPQDAFNDALIEMTSIITGRQIVMDSHALMNSDMTDAEIREEARRRDALFKVAPNARFDIGKNTTEFEMYKWMLQSSRESVREASGIYNTLSGQSGESQRSGVAVASLAELSSQTLSKITDNAHYAAIEVGKKLLAYHVADQGGRPRNVFVPGKYGKNGKKVDLDTSISNDTQLLFDRFRVVMTGRAETSKEHLSSQVQIIIQSLSQNPELQQQFLSLWIEMQEFPGRDEYLKIIQDAIGRVDEDNPTPGQKARMEAQQAQAQLQQQVTQAELEAKQAEVRLKNAQAAKAEAEAVAAAQPPAPPEMSSNDESLAEKQRILDEARAKMF